MLSGTGNSQSSSPNAQQPVEPNLAFIASNETVSTTPPSMTTAPSSSNMSPPPSRLVPQASSSSSSNRPSTLLLTGQRTATGPASLLTPNDYSKLNLSTPELDDKVRGYTATSTPSAGGALQTPDLINSIANVMNAQTLMVNNNSVFVSDGQPSPGIKVIEELINAQQLQQQTTLATLSSATAASIISSGDGRQFYISPSDTHDLLRQLASGETGNEQLHQLAQALQKAVASAASTPTSADGQSQAQEAIIALLQNTLVQQQPQQQSPMNGDGLARNRSISSSMDASMNGNDSSSPPSNSNSSTAASPLSNHLHQSTILLGKVKDEPQHVPNALPHHHSMGGGHMAVHGYSGMDRIDMDGNEVLKKEKKRERNRQAAQKCRTRKLNRIAELQKRVNELQDNNRNLSSAADRLKIEISKLERQLQEHQSHGCTLIATSVSNTH